MPASNLTQLVESITQELAAAGLVRADRKAKIQEGLLAGKLKESDWKREVELQLELEARKMEGGSDEA